MNHNTKIFIFFILLIFVFLLLFPLDARARPKCDCGDNLDCALGEYCDEGADCLGWGHENGGLDMGLCAPCPCYDDGEGWRNTGTCSGPSNDPNNPCSPFTEQKYCGGCFWESTRCVGSPPVCASGATECRTGNQVFECDGNGCGWHLKEYCEEFDFYDSYVNYCSGNTIRKHQLFHNYYCEGGVCVDQPIWQNDQLVEDCDTSDGCVGTTFRDYSCSGSSCIYTDFSCDSLCNTPPNIPALITPPNDTWINYNPTFQAQPSDPDNGNVRAYFNVSGYGDNWGNWVGSGEVSQWGPVNLGTCADYWWRAYSQDSCGNSDWSGYWKVKVDKDAPSCSINYPTGSICGAFPVTLTGLDSCSGIARGEVEIRIDEGNWQDYKSTTEGFDYTGSAGHSYEFRYRVQDNTGNWSLDWVTGGKVIVSSCDDSDTCYPYGDGCEDRDYSCSEGSCVYSGSNQQTDFYDSYVNYCSDATVRKHKLLHDYYCEGGTCADHTSWQDDQLVQDCGSDYCEDWYICGCDANYIRECRTCHKLGCSGDSCYDNTSTETRQSTNCDDSDTCYPYGDGCEDRDYSCSEGSCVYSGSNQQTDFYDSYVNYCSGTTARTHRLFYDWHCDGETCGEHISWQDDELVKDCGSDYWTDNYRCEDALRQREYISQGCKDGACYSNSSWQNVENCGKDYCEDWYICGCDGSYIKKCRACHSQGCSGDSCYDNTSIEETKTITNCDDSDTCIGNAYRDYDCFEGSCIYADKACDFHCDTPPDIPILQIPSNDSWLNYDPVFKAEVSDPDGNDVRTYFNVSNYGDNWGEQTKSGEVSQWGPVNLGACVEYWWRAHAQDACGFDGDWTGYWKVKVDKDLPNSLINYPDGVIYSNTFAVILNESDDCSGIKGGDLDVSIDGGSWQYFSNAIDDFDFVGSYGHSYQLRYRVKDNADNWSDFIEGKTVELRVLPEVVPVGVDWICCPELKLVFSWDYSHLSDSPQIGFQIQIDDNNDFSSPVINTGEISDSQAQYVLTGDDISKLSEEIEYFWQLRVKNALGDWSEWKTDESSSIFIKELETYSSS